MSEVPLYSGPGTRGTVGVSGFGLRVPEILDSGLREQDFGCLQNPAREETAAGLALEARWGFRVSGYEGRYKATWKREFEILWRKAGLLISGLGLVGCQ